MACIHVAGLMHETNTFFGTPTSYRSFEEDTMVGGILRGAQIEALMSSPLAVRGFMATARQAGHQVHPLLFAGAGPSSKVITAVFDQLMDELLASLRSAPAPDAVFLDLHGAMVVEDYDDGEAEIVRRIRDAVGAVPIACTFDLHGNIARSTLAGLDLAAGYLTYPHVDMAACGAKIAALLDGMLASGRRPALAYRQLPFLIPDDCQTTDLEPAKSLYDAVARLDAQPGVWTASLMEGFYQADVEFAGPSIFVYADDQQLADRAADAIETAVMAAEPAFALSLVSAAEAAEIAAAWDDPLPLLLADIQDNPGGGGAADNVEILEALVERDVEGAAIGMICDPAAADRAHAAGVGARISLALGGRSMPGQRAFAAEFIVTALNDTPIDLTGPFAGVPANVGRSAVLRIGGVQVVVLSRVTQCLDRAYFRAHGIDPESQRVLVVKSANHYRADFAAIVGRVVNVATHSACVADATKLPYRKLREGVRLSGLGPRFTRASSPAA